MDQVYDDGAQLTFGDARPRRRPDQALPNGVEYSRLASIWQPRRVIFGCLVQCIEED